MREEWRAIRGYTGRYEVSNRGRVRSWLRGTAKVRRGRPKLRKLVPNPHRSMYLSVTLTRPGKRNRLVPVHLLVLRAYGRKKRRGEEARHRDGKVHNNDIRNLSWATHAVNMNDLNKHGTRYSGERCPWAKLTAADVRGLRAMHRLGWGDKTVGEMLGVRWHTIYDARTGRSWINEKRIEPWPH